MPATGVVMTAYSATVEKGLAPQFSLPTTRGREFALAVPFRDPDTHPRIRHRTWAATEAARPCRS